MPKTIGQHICGPSKVSYAADSTHTQQLQQHTTSLHGCHNDRRSDSMASCCSQSRQQLALPRFGQTADDGAAYEVDYSSRRCRHLATCTHTHQHQHMRSVTFTSATSLDPVGMIDGCTIKLAAPLVCEHCFALQNISATHTCTVSCTRVSIQCPLNKSENLPCHNAGAR